MIQIHKLKIVGIALGLLISSVALLVAQDEEGERGYENLNREALEKEHFVFHDAYISVSTNRKFVWLTKTGSDSKRKAQLQLFGIAPDFSELTLLRKMELVNPIKPSREYLTPDGRFFVTFDEAGTCGNSSRDLVVYDLALSTTVVKRIADFIPDSLISKLGAPVYMGGNGLKEWHKFIPWRACFDRESMTLYPTAIQNSNLKDESSSIPFLQIDLLSGSVKVAKEDDETIEFAKANSQIDHRNSGDVQADWATLNGTRDLSGGTDAEFIGLTISKSAEGKSTVVQAGFQLNPKTGNYTKIDWPEFLSKSNSKLSAKTK